MRTPATVTSRLFSFSLSDKRVQYIRADSTTYFDSPEVKEQPWYGTFNLCATDPPWGVLKDANGPGQADELIPPAKIRTLAKGLYAAGAPEAMCCIRLILDIYMDWKRAFLAEGWFVQMVPKISYKGARFVQKRNTKPGRLSGKIL